MTFDAEYFGYYRGHLGWNLASSGDTELQVLSRLESKLMAYEESPDVPIAIVKISNPKSTHYPRLVYCRNMSPDMMARIWRWGECKQLHEDCQCDE